MEACYQCFMLARSWPEAWRVIEPLRQAREPWAAVLEALRRQQGGKNA